MGRASKQRHRHRTHTRATTNTVRTAKCGGRALLRDEALYRVVVSPLEHAGNKHHARVFWLGFGRTRSRRTRTTMTATTIAFQSFWAPALNVDRTKQSSRSHHQRSEIFRLESARCRIDGMNTIDRRKVKGSSRGGETNNHQA